MVLRYNDLDYFDHFWEYQHDFYLALFEKHGTI